MSVPVGRRWAEPLRQTLRRVYDPTTRTPVPWLLAGEAALALQGVPIEPASIEFRAVSPFAVAYFAQLMRPYEAPEHDPVIVYRRGGNMAPSDLWRSNTYQRVVAWSAGGRATWLGRWPLAEGESNVEVSYLRNIHPDPVGLALKSATRRVSFEGMEVPVVGLEFALADAALKGHQDLAGKITYALRACGHNPADLRAALALLPREKAIRLLKLVEFSVL